MFTVLLGKPTRLFHQNRYVKSVTRLDLNFGPIECSFDCVSLIFILFIVRDIQGDYHQHLTRWLTYVSCALNFVALKCWENCRTYINSLLNWTSAFAYFEPTRWNLLCFFFKYFSSFPISKQRKLKVFTCINKRFCTLFRLWWGQCNPPGTTYTRAVVQVKWGDEIW